jgi:ATP-dependent Zn protease
VRFRSNLILVFLISLFFVNNIAIAAEEIAPILEVKPVVISTSKTQPQISEDVEEKASQKIIIPAPPKQTPELIELDQKEINELDKEKIIEDIPQKQYISKLIGIFSLLLIIILIIIILYLIVRFSKSRLSKKQTFESQSKPNEEKIKQPGDVTEAVVSFIKHKLNK